jgi:hypothetical protein
MYTARIQDGHSGSIGATSPNRTVVKAIGIAAALWLLIPAAVSAQQTILSATRSIDWTHAGVTGGVPARTTICSSLTTANTLAQINAAIAACPANQVVVLAAGTYNLAGAIRLEKNNVTLRGAGPDRTKLVFSSSAGGNCMVDANVCISNGSQSLYEKNPGHAANWTGGYTKGTTQVTLDSVTGLGAGDLLMLDQIDDSDTDNGQLWVCSTMGVCSTEGDADVRRGTAPTGRSQVQATIVTAINGFVVTIASPLYMPNWRSGQAPGAYWDAAHTATGIGLESLSLDYSALTNVARAGINVTAAKDWWIKNVRSLNSDRAAIWLYGAGRGTIRDSYFYGTKNGQTQSYGIETDANSDLLVENNIFQHIATPMVTGEAVTGNVYGYNYAVDDYFTGDPAGTSPFWMQQSSYHHSSGESFHLCEGNEGIGFMADPIHGTQSFATSFRNYYVGYDPAGGAPAGKTLQTIPIIIQSSNRFFNFVGNVLGKVGLHTVYEMVPAVGGTLNPVSGTDASVYALGWSGNQKKYDTANGDGFNLPNDPLVRTTLMRWGNYDVVSAAPRWVSAEVPSGLGSYANAVPPNRTLPRSFYLSSTPPPFFNTAYGAVAYPPIGPDVTGGNITGVGGFANHIPAQVCYSHMADDPAYAAGTVRTFSATTCYAVTSGPPATPTGLVIGK